MPTKVSKAATQIRDLQADILQLVQLESPVQEAARLLYNSGFNVFPLPYKQKKPGYKWRDEAKLQLNRLHQDLLHAVFAGRCNIGVMAGKTSNNLFILDCDSPRAFDNCVTELKTRNIPLWAVLSARGGHIYLRCEKGIVNNIRKNRIPDIEVRGDGIYVLAPPSVHPDDIIYQWHFREGSAPPTVNINQIDWLIDFDGHPVCLTATYSRPRPLSDTRYNQLTPRTRDTIENGHQIPEGQRHDTFSAASWNMACCGYNETEIRTMLEPKALASGMLNARDPGELNRMIQGAVREAPQANRKRARLYEWERAREFFHAYAWQGRTRSSDKAVALALVERLRLGGNHDGVFRATVRDIALLAHLSTTTVQACLCRMLTSAQQQDYIARLQVRGSKRASALAIARPPAYEMLSYVGEDKASGGSLWQFTKKVLKGESGSYKTDTLSKAQKAISGSVPDLSDSDAVEKGALGQTGMDVYSTLLKMDSPALPKALAQKGNFTARQVTYALRPDGWLRKSGLVERVQGGWIAHAADRAQLDERVSRPAGTLGKGEQRRHKFERERELKTTLYIIQWRKAKDKNYFEPVTPATKGTEVAASTSAFLIEKSA